MNSELNDNQLEQLKDDISFKQVDENLSFRNKISRKPTLKIDLTDLQDQKEQYKKINIQFLSPQLQRQKKTISVNILPIQIQQTLEQINENDEQQLQKPTKLLRSKTQILHSPIFSFKSKKLINNNNNKDDCIQLDKQNNLNQNQIGQASKWSILKEKFKAKEYWKNLLEQMQNMQSDDFAKFIISEQKKFDHNQLLKLVIQIMKTTSNQRTKQQLRILVQSMNKLEFFKKLQSIYGSDNLEKFCKFIQYVYYKKDTEIFRYGQKGDCMYIILKGIVDILIPSEQNPQKFINIGQLQAGQTFGELALKGKKGKRTATIQCQTNVHLASLKKSHYLQIIEEHNKKTFENEMKTLQKISFLQKFSFLKIKELQKCMFKKVYQQNAILFNESEPVYNIYYVYEGDFEIFKKINQRIEIHPINIRNELDNNYKKFFNKFQQKKYNQQISIQFKSEGNVFGVEDLYYQRNHTYTAKCKSISSVLWVFKANDFKKLILNQIEGQKDIKNYVIQTNGYIENDIQKIKHRIKLEQNIQMCEQKTTKNDKIEKIDKEIEQNQCKTILSHYREQQNNNSTYSFIKKIQKQLEINTKIENKLFDINENKDKQQSISYRTSKKKLTSLSLRKLQFQSLTEKRIEKIKFTSKSYNINYLTARNKKEKILFFNPLIEQSNQKLEDKLQNQRIIRIKGQRYHDQKHVKLMINFFEQKNIINPLYIQATSFASPSQKEIEKKKRMDQHMLQLYHHKRYFTNYNKQSKS